MILPHVSAIPALLAAAGGRYGDRGRFANGVAGSNVGRQEESAFGDERHLRISVNCFGLFNLAGHSGFETVEARPPDRYVNLINPRRPRVMQLNLRYVS